MRTINSKGFGLIGLIITIAIIAMLVFGAKSFSGKNQIEAGQSAIDQANEAKELQNQNTNLLQNELLDPPPVNFHGIQDKVRNMK